MVLVIVLFGLALAGSSNSMKLPGVVTVINEQFFESGKQVESSFMSALNMI